MLENSEAFSGFSVADIDSARKFYAEILGIPVTERNGKLRLGVAGGTPILVYPKADHQPAAFTILNFPVPDVEAAVDELAARGVPTERLPGTDERGISRHSDTLVAWFKDPAGNWLSLIQT
jgi:catechol 2,3-dioxygenase-like lactoylglutathione lyase family enzyme